MPCPTCGHTLERLADHEPVLCWCGRCGTITVGRPDATGNVHAHAPKLVERCRAFERAGLLEGLATVAAVSL